MPNNIVDNIEQCCPNNIVASCFQQLLIFGRVDRRSLPGFQSLGAFEKESRRRVSSKIEVIPNKVCIIRLYTITQILKLDSYLVFHISEDGSEIELKHKSYYAHSILNCFGFIHAETIRIF